MSATWNALSRPGKAGRALALILLFTGWLLPVSLAAQPSTGGWTFAHGRTTTAVAELRTAGYPAVPLSELRNLGAEVRAVENGATLRLGGTEIRFEVGSPFFTQNGIVRQLIDPVYEQGGALFLPLQFVVEYLPLLPGSEIGVDLESRAVRRGSGAAPSDRPTPSAAAPEQPATSSPAAGSPLAQAGSAAARPGTSPAPSQAPQPRQAPAAAAARRAGTPAVTSARRLVVIDAGHGGVDPGARGPGGTREKDVALAVARRLAAVLREDRTIEVRMTRDRDTLIALTDRTRMANRWRGEGQDALFISIHTNAHDQRSVRGFETFFLSEAKTEDARRVAQMENAAQRYEDPAQKLDPLSFILHDLRQNKYLRDSSAWAELVQVRLASVHPGPNRGVKQAGFVVLNGAFMPAVLVELGFITHPAEERMLASAEHQARLARQLARAVTDFLNQSSAAATAR